MNEQTITHSMQQAHLSRQDWLAARQHSLGSSDAAVVLGVNPYKSAYTLWAEKTGLLAPSDEECEAMRWGNILEPVLATEYERQTYRKLVDHGRFTQRIHSEFEFVTATLDREILPNLSHPSSGVLELKTTGAHHGIEWRDEPPLVYQIQLQHQLAVTGWAWGSLAVLIGGQKFKWQDHNRNEEFIKVLLDAEEAFWKCVNAGTPPEIDSSNSTADTLRDLYKRDTGATVVLPGIAVEWDEELTKIKANLKSLEAKKQGLENKFRAELKDASIGILDGGISYTYKTQERAAYHVEATSFRVLRRAAKGAK